MIKKAFRYPSWKFESLLLSFLKLFPEYLCKFFNIIAGIIFTPESAIGFCNWCLISQKRDSADCTVKPDLFTNYVNGHIALSTDDLETGFLRGVGKKKGSL